MSTGFCFRGFASFLCISTTTSNSRRTWLCLQVYLPWARELGHAVRMWCRVHLFHTGIVWCIWQVPHTCLDLLVAHGKEILKEFEAGIVDTLRRLNKWVFVVLIFFFISTKLPDCLDRLFFLACFFSRILINLASSLLTVLSVTACLCTSALLLTATVPMMSLCNNRLSASVTALDAYNYTLFHPCCSTLGSSEALPFPHWTLQRRCYWKL